MKKFSLGTLRFPLSLIAFVFMLTACNQFGSEVKMKKNSVYYKNIPEAQAKKVGDYLYNIGYFSDTSDFSVQVSKPKDSIEFRIVVDKNKLKPEFDEQYLMIISDLSDSIFSSAPLVVYLADTDLKEFKRVGVTVANFQSGQPSGEEIAAILKETERVAQSIGSNVKEMKGNKLFYDNNVEVGRVNELANFLLDGGYFAENSGHIAVITKQGNNYIYKEAFIDDQLQNEETVSALAEVAASIKQSVFANDNFTFEMCNLKFETKETFNPKK